MAARRLNPSILEGEHRSRVFIGGSYRSASRALLSSLASAARDVAMIPVLADEYDLAVPEVDVHDTTLYLLHACRLAIFELSAMSGALMEIERVVDYGGIRWCYTMTLRVGRGRRIAM